MRLLMELEETVETIIESSHNNKEKSYYIEGKFLSADKPNKNKRVYPRKNMELAVERYEKDYINQRRALGECGHPASPSVNYDRATHIMENLYFQGSDVYGKAKVLSTPLGNILKTLIDEKVKVGVSSRGLGSMKRLANGLNEVQSDYNIMAIDIVNDPSGYECFVNGIMESSEWVNENGIWKMIDVDHAIDRVKKAPSYKLDEVKLDIFQQFLNNIK